MRTSTRSNSRIPDGTLEGGSTQRSVLTSLCPENDVREPSMQLDPRNPGFLRGMGRPRVQSGGSCGRANPGRGVRCSMSADEEKSVTRWIRDLLAHRDTESENRLWE